MNSKTAVGREAEGLACQYLQNRGLRLLQRNYLARCGEIDLVMQHGPSLVFVEVRYRRSNRFGSALDTVGPRKQSRLIATALHYLQCHRAAAKLPSRFDVVAITGAEAESGAQPHIEWVENAFQAGS